MWNETDSRKTQFTTLSLEVQYLIITTWTENTFFLTNLIRM